MKNKSLIVTTLIFFLLVNTSYYWEGKLGLFAIPFFLILAIVYFVLTLALLRHLFLAIKERFIQKHRLRLTGLLTAVLLLTFYQPTGLINFDKLQGRDVLVADREGAANCRTTLRLKDDYTFREQTVCFGISEINGTYRIIKDTIFFDNIRLGRHEDHFYRFAIIKPTTSSHSKIIGDLIRYKDWTDTVGHELWITKNDLQKLNDNSRRNGRALAVLDTNKTLSPDHARSLHRRSNL